MAPPGPWGTTHPIKSRTLNLGILDPVCDRHTPFLLLMYLVYPWNKFNLVYTCPTNTLKISRSRKNKLGLSLDPGVTPNLLANGYRDEIHENHDRTPFFGDMTPFSGVIS